MEILPFYGEKGRSGWGQTGGGREELMGEEVGETAIYHDVKNDNNFLKKCVPLAPNHTE